eukprot:TRINITY_DN23095_c0_g4_i1.p1 TRINITY_DN23095_c0_g4~~TRINITY_DN23095_c0_g4_i1.p1  ORF type:complete len:884 (+),score=126.18 TRINITY_DN23095_c0_g4_i1:114-2765(+)
MAARVEEAKLVRIGETLFLVDGFQFQRQDVCHYVLTHFHADHTIGLTRRFDAGVIYCTEATAALITELLGVDASRVRGLRLEEPLEVAGARLTFLDADHCPGSALAALEDVETGRLVLHTGDCRASEGMRAGLLRWLAGRRVDDLFLDTTYCNKRWCFPAQEIVCEWLQDIVRTELARDEKTLFIVGSYQIGKERAVQAVAEAASSAAYVEPRRWRVLQLAGWGEATRRTSGEQLWTIDKEGCSVWMVSLGGLGHEVLKHFLDSTKGTFTSVVAFRPTGWAWAPKRMSAEGSAGCRAWCDNDGKTRIYGVPYSEHSSYLELRALAEALKPRRLIPTVNSETLSSKERLMSHFLNCIDLGDDKERMDHYLQSASSSSSSCLESDLVDVLALSGKASATLPAHGMSNEKRERGSLASHVLPHRWASGILRDRTTKCPTDLEPRTGDAHEAHAHNEHGGEVVDLMDSDSDSEAVAKGRSFGGKSACPEGAVDDELRCVDVAQQKRLLKYFESASKPSTQEKANQKAKHSSHGASSKGRSTFLGRNRAGKAGAAKPGQATGPLHSCMGIVVSKSTTAQKRPRSKVASSGKMKRPRPSPAGGEDTHGDNGQRGGKDPKQSNERRHSRYVPRPSVRVQERIERAFSHRLYFLMRKDLDDGAGVQLDVLGSTGNVYNVKLQVSGNSCSCLDFAKSTGVCKHVLFVMLRILKLPRDDHRVWQIALVPSELTPLLSYLRDESRTTSVRADASVLRGYAEAQGESVVNERRPLPAECPICFETIAGSSEPCGDCKSHPSTEGHPNGDNDSSSEAVDYCRTCGHNVHVDCQRRWASVSHAGDTCPLCRSAWVRTADSSSSSCINLAAYSAEHRQVSLAALYPETHQWISRRDAP